jgi:hypothetical protein
MRISAAHEVNNVISLYSRGDENIENLLQRSVGRLAREQYLEDHKAIVEIDPDILQTVTDWFLEATKTKYHWLTSDRSSIELTKISSFSELADMAKSGLIDLNDSLGIPDKAAPKEELICQIPHGYHAYKIVSSEGYMEACRALCPKEEPYYILASRREYIVIKNKSDDIKAILHVTEGFVDSIVGENRNIPKANVIEAIASFCNLQCYKVLAPSSQIGHVIDRSGKWYHISDIPELFDGHLRLNSVKDVVLPKKLHVNGKLSIWDSTLKSSPEQIVAKGFTYSQSTGLKIPATLMIDGDIDFSASDINQLPAYLQTKGRVDISGTTVRSLPKGFVAKEVFADQGQITEFDESVSNDLVIGNFKPGFHMTTVGKLRKIKRNPLAKMIALFHRG